MILSIDIGGSSTHGVLMQGKKLLKTHSAPHNGIMYVRECHDALAKAALGKDYSLVFTGGGARKVRQADFAKGYRVVGEIEAIGAGGVFLSGNDDVFVVSIGTGTAFVSVKGGHASHAGGTGIGGGTILGLSQLMLGADPDGAERLAKSAKDDLDISVLDIVGGPLGKIPADATASNFGRASAGSGRAGAAASLLKLIAEPVGVMSYFAAKSAGQETCILVCGRVAVNAIIKRKIIETVAMFGGRASVPDKAEFCAAIGAAIVAGEMR